MGILDFLKKQFVDVIDWVEEPGDLAMRYPMEDREIQNGAALTVREGQVAFFYNEGQMADAFGPGMHTIETSNLPLLTALQNWDKGFQSPFKADVLFFTQKEQAGHKWGTSQPVTVRDKEFGPLRIRAFGGYSFRIEQPPVFQAKLMGTLERVRVEDVEQQLRSAIATQLATSLGRSEFGFVDMAADQAAMSDRLKEMVQPAFTQWGLSCQTFFVESVSLPEEVQKYLDKASSMRVVGDLDRFVKFQSGDAIEKAANQEGGIAGLGVGAGAGMAMGQAMAGALGGGAGGGAAPAPVASEDAYGQIEKLHKLLTIGAITQADFDAKKTELLGRIR
ncbi:SPFH domain-containing protein [Sphingomonas sp. S1-29]|uniref:SPFH domain-containing protein n=1 Tax=Sphingomonas sp. S1-29 TaxID=2991074 RepID=UPI00223F56A5|nr:SPFH domain-containing protein [Sphingomonas sp. S1-29]UZK68416.1 SPFH domain-containing protein [Sphingomonas sp. S1-29]